MAAFGVVVDANFNYSFQIKNAGPWGTYGGVTLTDVLPVGVTYVGFVATPGITCGAAGQTVTCQIPDHINLNGQSTTISLTVTASGNAQQIVNAASIAFTSPQTDSNTSNDTLTLAVTSKWARGVVGSRGRAARVPNEDWPRQSARQPNCSALRAGVRRSGCTRRTP